MNNAYALIFVLGGGEYYLAGDLNLFFLAGDFDLILVGDFD